MPRERRGGYPLKGVQIRRWACSRAGVLCGRAAQRSTGQVERCSWAEETHSAGSLRQAQAGAVLQR